MESNVWPNRVVDGALLGAGAWSVSMHPPSTIHHPVACTAHINYSLPLFAGRRGLNINTTATGPIFAPLDKISAEIDFNTGSLTMVVTFELHPVTVFLQRIYFKSYISEESFFYGNKFIVFQVFTDS